MNHHEQDVTVLAGVLSRGKRGPVAFITDGDRELAEELLRSIRTNPELERVVLRQVSRGDARRRAALIGHAIGGVRTGAIDAVVDCVLLRGAYECD